MRPFAVFAFLFALTAAETAARAWLTPHWPVPLRLGLLLWVTLLPSSSAPSRAAVFLGLAGEVGSGLPLGSVFASSVATSLLLHRVARPHARDLRAISRAALAFSGALVYLVLLSAAAALLTNPATVAPLLQGAFPVILRTSVISALLAQVIHLLAHTRIRTLLRPLLPPALYTT